MNKSKPGGTSAQTGSALLFDPEGHLTKAELLAELAAYPDDTLIIGGVHEHYGDIDFSTGIQSFASFASSSGRQAIILGLCPCCVEAMAKAIRKGRKGKAGGRS